MAEKVIGLRLQINGVPQTISNIKQLEEEISKLEGKLKATEIGSAEFSNLSNEIRTARGRLEDFNKSTEGFGFEKVVESVGKFSAGVTSAFATAGAAAQLFGRDSEDVNKAAQKAQNLLTIAIGATSIAEGILAARKLITTRATIAQTTATASSTVATVGQTTATVALTGAEVGATAATGGLTVAIKALGTAIKSNPIGLIIGLLASAAAAMYIFSDDTDDATAAVERLDAALKKNLQTIDDTTRRTQDDLKIKLAAAEAEGATIQELSDLRQRSYTLEINAQAQRIRAINDAYNKEKTILEKGLSEKEKLEEGHQKKLRELDEKYGSQRQSAIVAKNNAEVTAEIDKINTLKEIRDRDERLRDKSRDLQTSLIRNDLVKQLTELKNKLDDDLQSEENNAQTRGKLRKKYEQDYNKIIEDATNQNLELQIKITKELQDVTLSSYVIQLRDLALFNQEQFRLFISNSQRLNEATNEQNLKEYQILLYGEEQKLSLTEKQYQTLLKIQEKFSKQREELNKKSQLEGLKSLEDVQNKEILIRAKNGEDFINSQEELIKTQKDIYNQEFEVFKKSELDKLTFLASVEAQALKLEEKYSNPEEVKQKTEEFIKQRIEGYEKLFQVIKETGEKEIELNTKKLIQQTQIEKLSEDSTLIRLDAEKSYYDNIIKEQEGFVINDKMTKKQLEDNEREYRRKVRDEELRYAQQSLMIQKKLIEDKIKLLEKDPTMNAEALKTLYAELSKITVDYNNNVRQQTTNTATDTEDKFQDTIANIQKVVDQFSQSIGQIGSLLSQSYSLQLEKLELDYQNTLSQIVGDTEEANELREKEELMYQNKKKAIEKKARIDSLNIQLAQAVADTASAVLKTLAQYGATPVGIALSILAGGLGAIQIGLITQQKNMVQSMARGGFLRGASHEQGGIKYQGGGVELEGNESIINRRSTLAYAPLLSQINQQGGGRPIYVNSIMDSRMAEVLASVKSEPIRAYVLEQDITKSQAINRRLEELASY
jgi:hypothetical protein